MFQLNAPVVIRTKSTNKHCYLYIHALLRYMLLEVKGRWWLLLSSSLLITVVQQPGTSSPPSQLKHSSEGVIWMCRASFTWLGFIVEFTHTPSNEVHASGSLFNKPKHAPTPSAISYLCTSHLHAQIVIYILVSQVLCPYGTNCLRTFITVSLFLLLNLLSIMSTILFNMSHIFVSGCTSH